MSLPAHHYDDNHYPLQASHLLPSLHLQILLRLVSGTKHIKLIIKLNPNGHRHEFSSAKAEVVFVFFLILFYFTVNSICALAVLLSQCGFFLFSQPLMDLHKP